MNNPILTSGNQLLALSNFYTGLNTQTTIDGIPLGTSDGTATGELCAKVKVVNTVSVTSTPSGAAKTLTSIAPTTSGTVAAGKGSVSFLSSSDFVGTVNGVAFPANSPKSIAANPGDTINAIAYTISAGTLYIDTL